MVCEQACQDYIDADKEATAAEKRLQDFRARFVGVGPGKPAVVDERHFETWEGLEEQAARARQRSLEKLRAWRRKAASHRRSTDRQRRGDRTASIEQARREFSEAKKEWVAAQQRRLEYERQIGPTEPAPAETSPVGSPGWETWNRLHEAEEAARQRALEKEKAYDAMKGHNS